MKGVSDEMKKIMLGVFVLMFGFLLMGCSETVEPVNEADLIGQWGHGTGDHLGRYISSLTGRYIEFDANGVMSTASERHYLFSDEFDNSHLWTFSEPNIVTIGNEVYTVLVEGNRLIIENERGDQRIFQSID